MFLGALSKEGFLIVFQTIAWIWAKKHELSPKKHRNG